MNQKKTFIGILEDDPDMQEYLAHILKGHPDIQIVFSEATIAGAIKGIAHAEKVDICLVDLQLPDGNGADFVRYLGKQTNAKALILTILGDRMSVMAALEAGAHGYLLKDTAPNQIIKNIRETMNGANPISPQAATHLLNLFKTQAITAVQEAQTKSTLTSRETEILTLFAKGFSYKETAETLGISPHTVSDYVKSIYGKLSVHSRNEAVFEALQLGWIDL